jgi:phosphoglycerate kinase
MVLKLGNPCVNATWLNEAKRIQASAKAANCQILLPVDRVIVDKFGADAPFDIVATSAMPADREAVDVGPTNYCDAF